MFANASDHSVDTCALLGKCSLLENIGLGLYMMWERRLL